MRIDSDDPYNGGLDHDGPNALDSLHGFISDPRPLSTSMRDIPFVPLARAVQPLTETPDCSGFGTKENRSAVEYHALELAYAFPPTLPIRCDSSAKQASYGLPLFIPPPLPPAAEAEDSEDSDVDSEDSEDSESEWWDDYEQNTPAEQNTLAAEQNTPAVQAVPAHHPPPPAPRLSEDDWQDAAARQSPQTYARMVTERDGQELGEPSEMSLDDAMRYPPGTYGEEYMEVFT